MLPVKMQHEDGFMGTTCFVDKGPSVWWADSVLRFDDELIATIADIMENLAQSYCKSL